MIFTNLPQHKANKEEGHFSKRAKDWKIILLKTDKIIIKYPPIIKKRKVCTYTLLHLSHFVFRVCTDVTWGEVQTSNYVTRTQYIHSSPF